MAIIEVSRVKRFKMEGTSVFYEEFGMCISTWKNLGRKIHDGKFIGENGKAYEGTDLLKILSDMYDDMVE